MNGPLCYLFPCKINKSNEDLETDASSTVHDGISVDNSVANRLNPGSSTNGWSPIELKSQQAAELELQRELNSTSYLEFNSVLSNWIVGVTFFLLLYSFSHIIMKYFKKPNGEAEGETDSSLTIFLFTLSLSISLASIMLLPITIISHEILIHYPNNYYIQWLNRDLIFALWNSIFLGANMSMLVVIPFAYFYHEAEGLGRRGFLGRLYEATIVFILVSVIFGGFIVLLHSILSNGTHEKTDYLAFSYSLISTIGSILVLVSIPVGFTTLTTFGFNLKQAFTTTQKLSTQRKTINLDIQSLKFKLESNVLSDQEQESIKKKLTELTAESKKLSTASVYMPFLRNFLSLLLSAVNLLFPAYIVLRVVVKTFGSPDDGLHNYLLFEQESKNYKAEFAWIFETIGIFYLTASSFVGFYCLPFMKYLAPKAHDMPIYKIAINVSSILLLGSSLPVVAKLLGLTSFDLMGFYHYTQYIRSENFHAVYKILFMITMTRQYIKRFPKSQIIQPFESLNHFGKFLFVKKKL